MSRISIPKMSLRQGSLARLARPPSLFPLVPLPSSEAWVLLSVPEPDLGPVTNDAPKVLCRRSASCTVLYSRLVLMSCTIPDSTLYIGEENLTGLERIDK